VKDGFATIPEALKALRQGKFVIVIDDESRENEGDFIVAAEKITPAKINFMAKEGRGLICVLAPEERMTELGLEPMVPSPMNTALHETAFTVSVDAIRGTTTGISAADRARTVKVFVDPKAKPADLARPGHIFPIMARGGGVLVRAGHTEGSVDLMRLAGLKPVGVLCEIQNGDGTMARLPDLKRIARRHNLPLVTIKDIIAYRMQNERLVRRIVTARIPNAFGEWDLTLYEDVVHGETHLAMSMGRIGPEPTLVRVHSQCFTGDTLGSLRCDCGPQLTAAMARIAEEGRGAIVYMHQEGRGIGLKNKLLAYALQERGRDTVDANKALGFKPDLREYGLGAQILADQGVEKIRLMTNNPRKIVGITSFNLEIVERVPLEVGRGEHNTRYLDTKKRKLGHLFGEKKKASNGADEKDARPRKRRRPVKTHGRS
jgi:3,4-dihydroxy 2-butanone 4-phosphate synthase/GTP cyclohydrolase II